jgi:hypothetical protein
MCSLGGEWRAGVRDFVLVLIDVNEGWRLDLNCIYEFLVNQLNFS